MTFHEAGLQILETAGRPLSSQEITARAVQAGLLSHVGQIPEQTMRQRLAELARRSRNRRVAVVGPAALIERIRLAADDLRAAGNVELLELDGGAPELVVEVQLAEPDAA